MEQLKEDLEANAPEFLKEFEKELFGKQGEDKSVKSNGMEKLKQDLAKNAPEFLAEFEKDLFGNRDGNEEQGKVTDQASSKKSHKEQWRHNAKPADFAMGVAVVKAGWCNVHAAHLALKLPVKLLYRAVKEGTITPSSPDLKRKDKTPRMRLTKEEEQYVNNYALALYKIGFPATYLSFVPLGVKILRQRGGDLKDPRGWGYMFIKRHPDLHKIYTAPKMLDSLSNQQQAEKLYNQLDVLYKTHHFLQKPSRIYSCDAIPFQAERWGPDETTIVNVEILVAANAVGYHILPPCVVYAEEGDHDIPDFVGLPEVGFVTSSEKKVTAAILAEWFSSVFLHYLPSRSAEDPIALLIYANPDWFSPELVGAAEKEHVHLVPICQKIRSEMNPVMSNLHKLRDAYKDAVEAYKRTQIARQFQNIAKKDFFPVQLYDSFSDHFSMRQIQNAFKTTGVYPFQPDINLFNVSQPTGGSKENLPSSKATNITNDANEAAESNKHLGSSGGHSSTDGDRTKSNHTNEVVFESNGSSIKTTGNASHTTVTVLIDSTQKPETKSAKTLTTTSNVDNTSIGNSSISESVQTISTIEVLGVPPKTPPVKKPTLILKAMPSKPTASLQSAATLDSAMAKHKKKTFRTVNTTSPSNTSKKVADKVCGSLDPNEMPNRDRKQTKKFDLDELDSILVVKKQNQDRRIYVVPKKDSPPSIPSQSSSDEKEVSSSSQPVVVKVLKIVSPSEGSASTKVSFDSTSVEHPTLILESMPATPSNNEHVLGLRRSPRKQAVVARQELNEDMTRNEPHEKVSLRPIILGSRKRNLFVSDLLQMKRSLDDVNVMAKKAKSGDAPNKVARPRTRSKKR